MEFNKLIPELSVKDVNSSHRFYTETLGFKTEYSRPQDKFHFISNEASAAFSLSTKKSTQNS